MKNDSEDRKDRRMGAILFFVGLIGAFVTVAAILDNRITFAPFLLLLIIESLCMGLGGVWSD